MKYSYHWLQSHIEEQLPSPDTLKEIIIFHAFEVEDLKERGDDYIFDIKTLPDRNGDALSHHGMARELAGLLSLSLKASSSAPLVSAPLSIPVELTTTLCRRYIAIALDGVKVGDSPAWLQDRLTAIGQKPINAVVDAANFVMFDTGQPIHVFDAAKIDGGIVVRPAHAEEKITTLSGEEKILSSDMVVVADYLGALAIAGVKGGKNAEVTHETTSIIVEIANFDPASVRKTARTLALPTDASKRFENDLSPELASHAAMDIVDLVLRSAGGTVLGVSDTYPTPETPRTLSFTLSDITRLLGSTITTTMIASVFDRYQYLYTQEGESFTLTVPLWRRDITGAHDIAEEIGRVIGYDTIPADDILPFVPKPLPHEDDIKIRAVREQLLTSGYSEVMTYTFGKKGDVAVAHGAKGKDMLRNNLLDGLKESLELNRRNAPLLGISDIKIFEIGTVFLADREEIHVATVAGDKDGQECTLDQCIEQNKEYFVEALTHPVPYLSVTQPITPFVSWSAYPFIVRDISVWLASASDEIHLQELLANFAATYCVRAPYKIDSFEKEGRTSVAYRLVFQAFDRTLTEEEVTDHFSLLTAQIAEAGTFDIR